MLRSIAVKSSPDAHGITQNRCRARNCSRGFYFDPVTFDTTVTSTKAVFGGAEIPEKDDFEGVDEVSFDFVFRNTSDSRSQIHRLLESVLKCLINRLDRHLNFQSRAVCYPLAGDVYYLIMVAEL